MALKLRGATWHYNIWHQGENHRGSTGCTDRKEAQRVHDEYKAKLWSRPRASGKTWNDAFLKWLNAKERSESDCYCLRALQYANRPLHHCTVESFTNVLDTMAISPATYNRYISRIQAVLNLSGQHIKIPKKPAGEGRLRFLTEAEWERLYAELPAHLKPMALFAVKTGLRRHNVTHLMWEDVDMARKTLRVHADQTKAGKALGIPLGKASMAVLEAQQEAQKDAPSPWVFPYRSKPVTSVKTAFGKALQRAGLQDFTWHGLRHTWASWHAMNGTDLPVLQELGGWASYTMVQRYAHLAPEHLAKYADNAEPQPAQQTSTKSRKAKQNKVLRAA